MFFFFLQVMDPSHKVHLPLHKFRYHNIYQTSSPCLLELLEILDTENQLEYLPLVAQNHQHNSKR